MADDSDCVTHFLKTGSLRPLVIGMTYHQIVDAVGLPDAAGHTRRRQRHDNCVLLYGETDKVNLQLPIAQGKLTGIWLYFRGSDDMSSLPQWMNPDRFPLRGTMTLNEFFSFAEFHQLPWRIAETWTFEDQTTFLLPRSNIHLIWGHDPDSLYAAMLTT